MLKLIVDNIENMKYLEKFSIKKLVLYYFEDAIGIEIKFWRKFMGWYIDHKSWPLFRVVAGTRIQRYGQRSKIIFIKFDSREVKYKSPHFLLEMFKLGRIL